MSPAREYVTRHVRIDDAAIDAIKDAYSLIAPIWWGGISFENEQQYRDSVLAFPRQQRLLYAVFQYTAQVNNGGHDQFYFNYTAVVWQDARAGFQELHLDEAVAILDESVVRLGCNPFLDTAARRQHLDSLEPDFGDLDQRLYALEKAVNIDELMYQYILKNRGAFYFDGDLQMAAWAKWP